MVLLWGRVLRIGTIFLSRFSLSHLICPEWTVNPSSERSCSILLFSSLSLSSPVVALFLSFIISAFGFNSPYLNLFRALPLHPPPLYYLRRAFLLLLFLFVFLLFSCNFWKQSSSFLSSIPFLSGSAFYFCSSPGFSTVPSNEILFCQRDSLGSAGFTEKSEKSNETS